VAVQLLRGLVHVHARHVVHCDLKPGNLFFARGSSVVKTGDFGLARRSAASAARAEGHFDCVGTPTYAAPEQQRGEVTCASDMFSVGIILYEVMTPPLRQHEFISPSAMW
jgi:serine/threonine protein kinase